MTDYLGALVVVEGAVQRFVYSALGELVNLPPSQAATTKLFQGEDQDRSTGLRNHRARWANSNGFLGLDEYSGSQTNPQSYHKYGFAQGDAINGLDPTGLFVSIVSLLSTSNIQSSLVNMQGAVGSKIRGQFLSFKDGVDAKAAIDNELYEATSQLLLVGGFAVFASTFHYVVQKGAALLALSKRSGSPIVLSIGENIIRPGTLIGAGRTPGRLVPGTPGIIAGGSSRSLRDNLLRAQGVKDIPTVIASNVRAHHIIPTDVARNSPLLQMLGFDLDDATNGVLLDSTMHRGSHPAYSEAMEKVLDELAAKFLSNGIVNNPAKLQDEVYLLQGRAVEALSTGSQMHLADGADVNTWLKILRG